MTFLIVAACFLLSGFAALIYQTAWLRQFSVVFGTSEPAVATVLAAYMAGLAAGAALAGRFIGRVRRPVLVYGLLEGGIAASALAMPALLSAAAELYVAVLGGRPEPPDAATLGQPLFYLVTGFLVLAVPTGLMGATLPLLTRYAVRCDAQVGPRVALLYAINTAGAVAGTLCAGFVLLSALGLKGTVGVGVAVNASIFFIAVWLARRRDGESIDTVAESASAATHPGFFRDCIRPLCMRGGGAAASRASRVLARQPAWMLPFMLVSGANAFLYEVLWTRMLSHVLGGSIYAFATMLAAFLGGITVGSAAAGRLAATRERAAVAFTAVQVAIAGLSAGIYAWMQALVPAGRGIAELTAYAVAVMLPATVFIGATFPLAVRVVAPGEKSVAPATAGVYAWNTMGAIVGAVLTGFLLIPALGFEGSIRLAVLVNLGIALAASAVVAPFRRAVVAPVAALGVLALLFYAPARPTALIERTAFATESGGAGRELYYGVGRSATVLLKDHGGVFRLTSNGLPEAAILPKGAPRIGQPNQWLTALAVAARPEAESMLVVGFGGGVALEDVPAVDTIDVIELEPEIVAANRRMSGLRGVDPLADPRINVVLNDARNALRLTDKRYDLIVSQPSHPWTAGASHLFTREFAALARQHLHENGVFLQWVSASFVDEPLLRSLAATLVGVFDNVRLYQSGPSMFFLGSDGRLDIERELLRSGRPLREHVLHYSYLGLNSVNDFIVALALDERGVELLADAASSTTDDRNRMATDSRSLADGMDSVALMRLLEPYDPLLDARSGLRTELGEQLDFTYIASRLLTDGRGLRARLLEPTVQDVAARSLIRALRLSALGQQQAARMAVLEALESDPDHADAGFALIQPHLASIARGAMPEDVREIVDRLPRSAAAVVAGSRMAASQDWRGLANLDRVLASAATSDLWFPDAVRLRAEWRVQVENDTRYAFDALRLVDRSLVLRPSLELLVLRVAAAQAAGDADALAESARAVAARVRGRVGSAERAARVDGAELARMTAILDWLRDMLERLDTPSAEIVLREIGEVLLSVEAALPKQDEILPATP